MRIILAGFIVLVVAGITGTWFWTIPKCLSSGWGTRLLGHSSLCYGR